MKERKKPTTTTRKPNLNKVNISEICVQRTFYPWPKHNASHTIHHYNVCCLLIFGWEFNFFAFLLSLLCFCSLSMHLFFQIKIKAKNVLQRTKK